MKYAFTLIAVCCLLFFTAGTQPLFAAGSNEAGPSKKVSITVANGVLKVGKKTISDGWRFSEFREALGEKYIIGDEGVLIHYPETGLTFYLDQNSDLRTSVVREVHLYFSHGMDAQEQPVLTHPFPGKVKVDQLQVTKGTTVEAAAAALKDYTFEESYFDNSVYCAKNGIYFFFHAKEKGGSLTYISFGPDL